MTEAKIGAALPKTSDANGLHSIAHRLLEEPSQIRYAVIAVDCGAVSTEYKFDDYGDPYTEVTPRARIRAIEPLAGSDAAMAERLMHQARGERTGRPALELDFSVADVAGE
jgi:hypothetical protein